MSEPLRLTDLPNVGPRIAADLQAFGIATPEDLRGRDPLTLFRALKPTMGTRHDPCVYYTLLSVQHFFETGAARPWWHFTAAGKAALATASTEAR